MFYRKNLPGWERAVRSVGGVVMIAYGLLGMPGLLRALAHLTESLGFTNQRFGDSSYPPGQEAGGHGKTAVDGPS
jgi:hypothetical protein